MADKFKLSRKAKKIILGACIGGVVVLTAGLFTYIHIADTNTLGRKISIYGMDVSTLTADKAEQKLLDAFCDIRSHITLLHKEQRHRQTDKIDQNHQHDRADDRENHRNFHAILNSVNFAGSEVLAGVGRKCCAKSFKRLCKDHQDLHSSIDCHNGIGAEQVYCTLEDNTSDCCDGKLQSHWHTDRKKPPAHGKVKPEINLLKL